MDTRLILIASASLAQVRLQLIINVEQNRQEDGTVPVSSDIIGEQSIPKEVLYFMNLIAESYNPIKELPLYTDEELQRLNMPILFIDGEDDVIIDAYKSAQRLTQLIPSAEIRLIPNCGHVVTIQWNTSVRFWTAITSHK